MKFRYDGSERITRDILSLKAAAAVVYECMYRFYVRGWGVVVISGVNLINTFELHANFILDFVVRTGRCDHSLNTADVLKMRHV